MHDHYFFLPRSDIAKDLLKDVIGVCCMFPASVYRQVLVAFSQHMGLLKELKFSVLDDHYNLVIECVAVMYLKYIPRDKAYLNGMRRNTFDGFNMIPISNLPRSSFTYYLLQASQDRINN